MSPAQAATKLDAMTDSQRAEQIRALADSLSADKAERERLKREADESLDQLHRAVRDFLGAERPRAHIGGFGGPGQARA